MVRIHRPIEYKGLSYFRQAEKSQTTGEIDEVVYENRYGAVLNKDGKWILKGRSDPLFPWAEETRTPPKVVSEIFLVPFGFVQKRNCVSDDCFLRVPKNRPVSQCRSIKAALNNLMQQMLITAGLDNEELSEQERLEWYIQGGDAFLLATMYTLVDQLNHHFPKRGKKPKRPLGICRSFIAV